MSHKTTAFGHIKVTPLLAARRVVVQYKHDAPDLYEFDFGADGELVLSKESTGDALYTVPASGTGCGCKSKQYRPTAPCRHEWVAHVLRGAIRGE